MNSYKEYRFCSNCKTQGSLKWVGHVWDGNYICRGCWDKINEVEGKMKKAIRPNRAYGYSATFYTCEG